MPAWSTPVPSPAAASPACEASDIPECSSRAPAIAPPSRVPRCPALPPTAHPWVRFRCQYGCPLYGKRLTCPPYSPTPEQTKEIVACFKSAILFEGPIRQVTPLAAALEREIFLSGYYKAYGMGGGPCGKCEQCGLEKGCIHPLEARPALEACGVDVYKTVRDNKWKIEVVETHQSTHRHFGIVLVA